MNEEKKENDTLPFIARCKTNSIITVLLSVILNMYWERCHFYSVSELSEDGYDYTSYPDVRIPQ